MPEIYLKVIEGYQHAISITKEVPIDGEWVIFRLFDDPELDMDVFKYCFYLKGRLSNGKKDREIVVLTANLDYNFEEYKKILSSQLNPNNKKYKTTYRPYKEYDKWGISLSAKNITNKGLTIFCEQFGGSPTGELQTGEEFSLKYSDNGDRKPVPIDPLIKYAWHQVA